MTTIGGGKDDDGLPSEGQEKTSPSLTPTRISPTAMPGGQPAAAAGPAGPAQPRHGPIAPTRIGAEASRPAPAADPQAPAIRSAPRVPIAVSGIGGASAKAVPLETLARRFPDAKPDVLARARAALLGYGNAAAGETDWLTFGVAEQSTVNAALKDQVALLESPGRRDASAHVARLHEILTDVLGAMEGGFFRKSAHTVWQQHSTEISHLETLLNRAGDELRRMLDSIAELHRRYATAVEELQSRFVAGQYLLDGMSRNDSAHLLQSRLMALTASQTLAQENRLHLQQQEAGLRELAVLIQDGVLVKLPSVVTQIAALPDKPTDTDRYLAREALSNLTQLFERSRTWH
ncbi:hypothetical protein [Paraburkholderia humisilvae]|uniref:hypothetical protein n=1 Tax=Paraburkholderia humisilvae TaxID=627669 RepID=UPI0015814606|nr:hypothetical protein [Paraburkholderia humisilvae]